MRYFHPLIVLHLHFRIIKASNGFSSFMMELKKEAGFHGSMTELAKLAGPKWDKLSLEERQKYRAERYFENSQISKFKQNPMGVNHSES